MSDNSQFRYIAYKNFKKVATSFRQYDLADELGISRSSIGAVKNVMDRGYEVVDYRPVGEVEVYCLDNGELVYSSKHINDIANFVGVSTSIIYGYLKFRKSGYELEYKKTEYDYIMYRGDEIVCVAESIPELAERLGISEVTAQKYIVQTPISDKYDFKIYRYVREDD